MSIVDNEYSCLSVVHRIIITVNPESATRCVRKENWRRKFNEMLSFLNALLTCCFFSQWRWFCNKCFAPLIPFLVRLWDTWITRSELAIIIDHNNSLVSPFDANKRRTKCTSFFVVQDHDIDFLFHGYLFLTRVSSSDCFCSWSSSLFSHE